MMENSNKQPVSTNDHMVEKHQESGAGLSRREFSRLGAPVLLTLASRPVFGGNCLSNMMSGNLSDPDRGECGPGWSPGGWKAPGGSEPDWSKTPFEYGSYASNNTYTKQNGSQQACGANKQNEWECYTGGTTLAQALGYHGLAVPGGLSGVANQTLRQILFENTGGSTGNFAGHFVAGLLNASHSGITYILTPQQLVDIYNDPSLIPEPYTGDFGGFMDSTWI
ncbi:MAG: hypothetical protein R3E57_05195 [Porticoccaceae bacterium]